MLIVYPVFSQCSGRPGQDPVSMSGSSWQSHLNIQSTQSGWGHTPVGAEARGDQITEVYQLSSQ